MANSTPPGPPGFQSGEPELAALEVEAPGARSRHDGVQEIELAPALALADEYLEALQHLQVMGDVGDPVAHQLRDRRDVPGAALEETNDLQPLGVGQRAEEPRAAAGLQGVASHRRE